MTTFLLSLSIALLVWLVLNTTIGKCFSFLKKISNWLSRIEPAFLLEWIDKRSVSKMFAQILSQQRVIILLRECGWRTPDKLFHRFVLLTQYFFAFVLLIFALLVAMASLSTETLFWFLSLLLLFLLMPRIVLSKLATKRALSAKRSLPFLIENVRILVQGGVPLEAALADISERKSDPLYNELKRVVFLNHYGMSLVDALNRLPRYFTQNGDFQRLVVAVSQAKQLGISVAEALKIQADTLRNRRKVKAQEKARTAAIKITLPLVFLIFPALMIVILAPAVLRIFTN